MEKGVSKFKFKCIPILPTVYSDSLSYMEVLGRVTQKLNDVINFVNGFTDEILAKANAYTDEQLAGYQAQLEQVKADQILLSQYVEEVTDQYKRYFEAEVELLQSQYNQFIEEVGRSITGMRVYTDTRIEENNDWLLQTISENIGDVFEVINPFTGDYNTMQEIVEYLANFHMDNAITYGEMEEREKTYAEWRDMEMTYTELAVNGKILFV